MMNISCPHCGSRPETEFVCGGESHIARPGPYTDVSAETWGQYLYFQNNPRGDLAERWCHRLGCGQWFNVIRNTLTHEISIVYPMGASRPTERGETR